jgi:enoyl reductase
VRVREVRFDRYGPPEVLYLTEAEPPVPGLGEVRVRVAVAGVQPFDIKRRRGDLAAWVPVTFPATCGNEYTGTVDALGEGVTGLAVGDPVLGSAPGVACADYAVVPAENAVPRPAGLAVETAGGLVAAGQTASGALNFLGVTGADTLLVHAAAGAVGTVAVQLARRLGATVIGTASERNHEYLRSLGAIPVTYGPGLAERVRAAAPRGVTVALDAIGGEAIPASIEAGVPAERVGTIADPMGARRYGAVDVKSPRSPQRLAEVVALAAAGELVLPVRGYPLAEVVAAHREVEGGHLRGKVVLVL